MRKGSFTSNRSSLKVNGRGGAKVVGHASKPYAGHNLSCLQAIRPDIRGVTALPAHCASPSHLGQRPEKTSRDQFHGHSGVISQQITMPRHAKSICKMAGYLRYRFARPAQSPFWAHTCLHRVAFTFAGSSTTVESAIWPCSGPQDCAHAQLYVLVGRHK
jgi:hypothetical protein